MRNSKVRRRIAAGKLRLRIRDLRNLGPRSETLLERIGIRSVEALRRRGAVEAYLALRRIGATRSLNMLWAMAGALDPWPEGRDWRDVAAGDQRLALLLAVDAADPAAQGTGARPVARGRRAAGGSRGAGHGPHPALGAWAPGLPFDELERRGATVAAGHAAEDAADAAARDGVPGTGTAAPKPAAAPVRLSGGGPLRQAPAGAERERGGSGGLAGAVAGPKARSRHKAGS